MVTDLITESEDVSDEKLLVSPYCSVGKLLIHFGPEDEYTLINMSAYYIGKDQIITAAHGFEEIKIDVFNFGVFIPAMKNKKDIHGENFGFYSIKEWNLHPRYLPCTRIFDNDNMLKTMRTPQYDICRIKIRKQLKTGLSPHSQSLKSLPLSSVFARPPFNLLTSSWL